MLTDATVVDLLRRHFVPVALNWKSGAGVSEDERRLRAESGLSRGSPTGTFVLRKDGTLLARGGGSSPQSLAAFLREALARVSPTPVHAPAARPSVTDRGAGLRPDGSIRLALTARAMKEGAAANPRPTLDSLYLSPARMRSLAPPAGAAAGDRYAIPDESAREFAPLLTDDGDRVYAMRPQDATRVRLEATVVSANDARIVVWLAGELAGSRPYSGGGRRVIESSGRLEGMLTFGPGGDLRSLLIVSDAEYHNPWARAPHTVGGLLEWKK